MYVAGLAAAEQQSAEQHGLCRRLEYAWPLPLSLRLPPLHFNTELLELYSLAFMGGVCSAEKACCPKACNLGFDPPSNQFYDPPRAVNQDVNHGIY